MSHKSARNYREGISMLFTSVKQSAGRKIDVICSRRELKGDNICAILKAEFYCTLLIRFNAI